MQNNDFNFGNVCAVITAVLLAIAFGSLAGAEGPADPLYGNAVGCLAVSVLTAALALIFGSERE